MRAWTAKWLLVALASAGAISAADWTGSYRGEWTTRLMEYSSDGTPPKPVDPIQEVCSLELQADHGLKLYLASETRNGAQWLKFGAWQLEGARLYYFVRQRWADEVHGYFGCQAAQLTSDGIVLADCIGGQPLIQADRTSLQRVAALEFPYAPPADFASKAKQQLDRVLAERPAVTFVGASSEPELKRRYHAAYQSADVAELMRLTYPLINDYLADRDSGTQAYLKYQTFFCQEGKIEIEDNTKAEAVKKLAAMNCCRFPDTVSVEGFYWAKRVRPQTSSGEAFFIGVVKGQWAILGGPLNFEAIEKKRGGRERR